jgi:hypothetical protein
MKNILVPIDFNEVSANALKYAYQCYSNDKIYICHVYSGLYSSKRNYIKAGSTKNQIIKEDLNPSMS